MGQVQLTRGRVVGGQNAQDHSPAVVRDQNHKFTYEKFDTKPYFSLGAGLFADPTGATGDENVIFIGNNLFEYHVLGTQTLLVPVLHATKGLDLVQDLISGDGTEVCPGITAGNRSAFTVGTDRAFYFKVQLELTDVSGISECGVGFRKVEAYQALIDGYDEMAAFNIQAGVINMETIINGNATVTTDSTETDWADAGVHTLEVRVSAAGVVTYAYDDAEPTVVAAFTFDDGEIVVPFVHQLLGNSAANNIYISEWQCGLGKRSV